MEKQVFVKYYEELLTRLRPGRYRCQAHRPCWCFWVLLNGLFSGLVLPFSFLPWLRGRFSKLEGDLRPLDHKGGPSATSGQIPSGVGPTVDHCQKDKDDGDWEESCNSSCVSLEHLPGSGTCRLAGGLAFCSCSPLDERDYLMARNVGKSGKVKALDKTFAAAARYSSCPPLISPSSFRGQYLRW